MVREERITLFQAHFMWSREKFEQNNFIPNLVFFLLFPALMKHPISSSSLFVCLFVCLFILSVLEITNQPLFRCIASILSNKSFRDFYFYFILFYSTPLFFFVAFFSAFFLTLCDLNDKMSLFKLFTFILYS